MSKYFRTPQQAIIDLEDFCVRNNRYPNQNSEFYDEKSLAQCIANYKSKKSFIPEQFNIINQLQSTYSTRNPQVLAKEKLENLRIFCEIHGHWPSQDSSNEDEKKIYQTCCRKKYYYSDPTLLNEYRSLKKIYLPVLSSETVLEELKEWVNIRKTTPRESSNNKKENKLAKNIKYLKSRRKFSTEESKSIEDIYRKFGPRGGTSTQEQILYHYLQATLRDALVSNRNRKYYNIEVDVMIEHLSKKIAIFFDGYFYHQDSSKDNTVNRKLTDHDIIVLRFREDGCPIVENCISISVKKAIKDKDFLLDIKQYFKSNKCPIYSMISNAHMDDEEILFNAKQSASSNYMVRGHLLSYIENALLIDDKPKTNSTIYRNCKACYQRKKFTKKECLLFAFAKRLFDLNPRKRRDIDEPSIINDDVCLLSKIIDIFYQNTALDKNEFKKKLTSKINEL